jgi:hypothetical protein
LREREHEGVDVAMERDLGAQMALKRCRLYNFWSFKGMRAQVRFLQLLVDYWDPDSESFNLDGQPLRIEVEDIYFLMGFSHQGEVLKLKDQGAKSGMKIEDYIDSHCIAWIKKVKSQLPVREINNISLKIVVLILTLNHMINLFAPDIEASYVLLYIFLETHSV